MILQYNVFDCDVLVNLLLKNGDPHDGNRKVKISKENYMTLQLFLIRFFPSSFNNS